MSVAFTALKIILVVGATGMAALYFLQHKLVFFPSLINKDFQFNYPVPFEEKFITYDGDKVVHGILFKPSSARIRILYFHGNGGSLEGWGEVGAELASKFSAEVLMMDYPGYGKSFPSLPPSEKGLLDSAVAALEDFNRHSPAGLPLIIYGRSLGSGVASFLAAHYKADGLILETPYLSIKAMAARMFPFVPSFLVRYDLDNLRNIQKINTPVLIVHGTADSVVPFDHGKKLSESGSNVTFIKLENGGHNDLAAYPAYWESVTDFVNMVSKSDKP